MAHIIAGHFQEQAQVAAVVDAMLAAGFPEDRISHFYLNPAGQHDLYPIGGDRDESPGAHESGSGVVTGVTAGGTVGAVAGLTGAAAFGPLGPAVGALIGAHVGGLVGSLARMKEPGEPEEDASLPASENNTAPVRRSGLLVAVCAEPGPDQDSAIALLQQGGADELEEADGTIIDGDWQDFDPLQPPRRIDDTRPLPG